MNLFFVSLKNCTGVFKCGIYTQQVNKLFSSKKNELVLKHISRKRQKLFSPGKDFVAESFWKKNSSLLEMNYNRQCST